MKSKKKSFIFFDRFVRTLVLTNNDFIRPIYEGDDILKSLLVNGNLERVQKADKVIYVNPNGEETILKNRFG